MNELTPASRCEWNATGLTLPEGLTFEEWSGLGDALAHQANGLMWWIGDWWLYGEHRYGEQASQAPALGLKPDTLSNAAAVASRVQMTRRRGNLTFSHHQAIAYLEPEVADALLTQAEEGKWTVQHLREVVNPPAEAETCPMCGRKMPRRKVTP